MGKTLGEKIFEAHCVDRPFEDVWVLRLDYVFCHEITTPAAVQDLAERNLDAVFDPRKIKAVIDHVSPAKDSKTAEQGKILRDWARRHRIDLFDVGRNGVCHALFAEKGFPRPGYTIIMGDSHTCTHGAFGAFAAGVGTTDLAVGLLKGVAAFRKPETLRVNLNGALQERVFAKDAILAVIAGTGVDGAVDMLMEFRGPVVDAMTMESRMTLSNMAVEAGATSGVCMPDAATLDYLWPLMNAGAEARSETKEEALAEFARWKSDDDARYAGAFDLDCAALEPLATVGYKPDQVKPLRELAGTPVDQVYIGSCTNGRIEDLREAAALLKGRKAAGTVRPILAPATAGVYAQALKEGIIEVFAGAGFCVTSPSCGACLGMSNGVLAPGEACASTTNRNFYGRMGKGGMVHLMSPASAAAAAITGCLTDPRDIF